MQFANANCTTVMERVKDSTVNLKQALQIHEDFLVTSTLISSEHKLLCSNVTTRSHHSRIRATDAEINEFHIISVI